MSVTSGFFDSKNKDRLYNTEQLSSIFDGIIKDGVYMGYEDAFIVKATDPASLTVNVGPGRAWFHHTWTHNDAPLPIVVKQGDVVLDRIDSIIIDIDKTEDVRSNKVTYLEGSPSSEPTAPVLVNEEKHWQIPLCNISMPAGSTTITQAQITNRIGTSDCPFVTGIIETIDTDELLAQWNAEYREWYERVQQEIDQWTEQEQEDFTNWMNGRKTEFDEWFAGIQDILDGDTAGNLLNRINHRTGINATATYSAGVVAITAPDDAGEILTFVAPSDFLSSDTYTLNGEALTITDLNGEALEEAWKKNSPITITVSGGKAFFKSGGSGGKNDTLPPLLGNMTVEVVEGDENDTYTIKMDKLILDKTTEMVGGAQLEWGEEMPEKPGKGTGGIKTWTREEIITTGKPYDGLYLGDVTPSDAVTETLIYLPENDGGSVKLVPFIVLGERYGGITCAEVHVAFPTAWDSSSSHDYEGSDIDTYYTGTYLNSVLHESVVNQLIEAEITVRTRGSSGNTTKTVKRKAFTLSRDEYGLESDSHAKEGEPFTYFSSAERRKASQEGKAVEAYHTRTLFYNSDGTCWSIDQNGNGTGSNVVSAVYPSRATIVLPKDFKIQQRSDGSYTVYDEYGLMTLSDIEASSDKEKVTILVEEKLKADDSSEMHPFNYAVKGYGDVNGGLLVEDSPIWLTDTLYGAAIWTQSNLYNQLVNFASAQTASAASLTRYLSPSLQKLLLSPTIGYRDGSGYIHTSKEKVFFLGAQELGYTDTWGETAGKKIPWYAEQGNRVMLNESNAPVRWYTRDVEQSGNYYAVGQDGQIFAQSHLSGGTRLSVMPCLVFPLDAPIRRLADGSYELVPEDPALSTQTVSTLAETGTSIQLKDIPPSTASKVILKVSETDGEKEYIALRDSYEGGTGYAFIRDSLADTIVFNGSATSGETPYINSGLDTYMTTTFKAKLSEVVQKYLVEVKVPVGPSGSGITIDRSIFAPSAYELGLMGGYNEGSTFTYFSSDASRQASSIYFTRTRHNLTETAISCVMTTGVIGKVLQSESHNARPIILLDRESWAIDHGDGTYTFIGDKEESSDFVSHTVEVPHGQKVVFRQFTQNQKKQFQTMLVGAVYPPLGDIEEPFALPEFTGNHAIFGDENSGRIELYESGELTLSPGTYDIFMVGGGAGGNQNEVGYPGGGAGSGYTKTISSVKIESKMIITASVGAGGTKNGGAGSATGLSHPSLESDTYTVNGAPTSYTGNKRYGGSGGSGGGTGSAKGGSNGEDGQAYSGLTPGTGQGTTTRAFGELTGTLYAAGGGGGGAKNVGGAAGGEGGGGAGGASERAGTAGTPNTGSGGGGAGYFNGSSGSVYGAAGGSGIIIIRWNNT